MLKNKKKTEQPATDSTYGYGCKQYSIPYTIGFCPDKFIDILFSTDYLLSNSTAQASGSYGYAQFGAGSLRGLL